VDEEQWWVVECAQERDADVQHQAVEVYAFQNVRRAFAAVQTQVFSEGVYFFDDERNRTPAFDFLPHEPELARGFGVVTLFVDPLDFGFRRIAALSDWFVPDS
jgi:hypothetical protein